MAEKFTLRIITPDKVFFEDDTVEMVEFNTTEGEIGILRGHIPLTVIVNPGVLKITMGSQDKYAALHAGFAEILQNQVTILAEIIEWPEEIDVERAEAAKQRAEQRISDKSDDIDIVRAEAALKRSMARLDVHKY